MGSVFRAEGRTVLPLVVKRGERWSYTLTVDEPASWSGWTGKAQLRTAAAEDSTLIAELGVDLNTDGQITVTLASAQTATLDPFTGVWDLYVTLGGERQYVAEGPATITARVTIPA